MIFFISLIFSLMLLVPKDCPQGWVLFGSLCYLLLDTPTSEWNDAQSLCQTHGAHLPIMRSADENNFMLSLVMSQPNGKVSGTWLGLTRRKSIGDFYWVDDTPLAGQFSAWADGEPNNPLVENCANIFMTGKRQGKWNDCFCSVPANSSPVVLCQKKPLWVTFISRALTRWIYHYWGSFH